MWVKIILGLMLLGALVFFRMKQKEQVWAQWGLKITVGAIALFVLSMLIFPGLYSSGPDLLGQDQRSMAAVGEEAGAYIASVARDAPISVVCFGDGGGEIGASARKLHNAFLAGLRKADGIGPINELRIALPDEETDGQGQRVPWFTKDKLTRVIGEAGEDDVLVVLPSLPRGVSAGAVPVQPGQRVVIYASSESDIRGAIRGGSAICGVLERPFNQAGDDGRFMLVKP